VGHKTAKKGELRMKAQQGQTKHHLVFEALKNEIISGKYKEGDRFPTEWELVERFGFSRPTVTHALRDLQADGFLERRQGSGTFLTAGKRLLKGYFGMIIPSHGSIEIFTPICAAISTCSQEFGYTLLFGHASAATVEEQEKRLLELCAQYIRQKVAGVFLEPLLELEPEHETVNRKILKMFEDSQIPVVLIDRDIVHFPERSAYDLVGIDNLSAGYRITDHLIRSGARKIIFMTHQRLAPTVQQRIAGMCDALVNAGIPWDASTIAYGSAGDRAYVRSVVGKTKKHRPDAIICANDVTALQLISTLAELGLRVPEDIRITGFDDVQHAKLVSPALTTVRQPCTEIGTLAAKTLMRRIIDPNTPPHTILLHAPLVIRKSA
jgi:DNA-binding LacI/PurR family transcriptional regulator